MAHGRGWVMANDCVRVAVGAALPATVFPLRCAPPVHQPCLANTMLLLSSLACSNLVYMGMGEPMHNLEAVLPSVDILCQPLGMHFSYNKVRGYGGGVAVVWWGSGG